MGTASIVISDEVSDGRAKMALADRNDEIQTLASDGPNEAFAECICGWRADWSSECAYAEILQRRIHCGGEYRVAVMDHESIWMVVSQKFTELAESSIPQSDDR